MVDSKAFMYALSRSPSNVGLGEDALDLGRGGDRRPNALDIVEREEKRKHVTAFGHRIRLPRASRKPAPTMASTISFPEEALSRSHVSTDEDEAQFYSSFVDASTSSGFQMNPLSSHPPRSPRHSIVSAGPGSSYHRTSIYSNKDRMDEEGNDSTEETDSVEAGEEQMADAQRQVRTEDVWRDMILTSNGRDKTFVRICHICLLPGRRVEEWFNRN